MRLGGAIVHYNRGAKPDYNLQEIQEALRVGKTKASICRNFGIKRSTLYDTLNRLTTNN
ncbi:MULTISPECIES: hypothetical protein [unclassified Candidatus Tisiphia]|uniref:hypothetical protein n=1 Tax=unclassified Candidatus Tisiphia TaxID=2996318 RepID=UPI001E6A9352|nr:MAG: hypothetical protein LF884_02365 [Rickettsia endosymbiont of Cimex lectularius]